LKRVLQRMIEDPMSEMILKGEIPNGSKVIIEPNETPYEEVAEGETIVNIRVTQPKEVVKVESE
jgi:ATP-dependent Clp protease ATP-binding subunit ClpC